MNEKSKQILAKIAEKKANNELVTAQVIADIAKATTMAQLKAALIKYLAKEG